VTKNSFSVVISTLRMFFTETSSNFLTDGLSKIHRFLSTILFVLVIRWKRLPNGQKFSFAHEVR